MIIVSYGSRARGGHDSYSDQDVLVVGNYQKGIRDNATWYTKNRLLHLLKAESLFLVHLKTDAVIQEDDDNWMKKFLAHVPLFRCRSDEIVIVRSCLTGFLLMNVCPLLRSWWGDVLYTLIRDFTIKLNSREGVYDFSPKSMLLSSSNSSLQGLQEIFLKLRKCKYYYRAGDVQPESIVTQDEVDFLRNSFLADGPRSSSFEEFINELRPYYALRIHEACSLFDNSEPRNDRLWPAIRNPHRYSWEIANGSSHEKINIEIANDALRWGPYNGTKEARQNKLLNLS